MPLPAISKRSCYALLSFLAVFKMIFQSFYEHQQLYPATAFLYESYGFRVAVTNATVSFLVQLSCWVANFFLGVLLQQEKNRIIEKFFIFFTEACVALSYFRNVPPPSVLLASVGVFLWKLYHQLASVRLDTLDEQTMCAHKHIRFVSFLAVLAVGDSIGLLYQYDLVVREGAGLDILFMMEFMLMINALVRICVQYFFHCYEVNNDDWDGRPLAHYVVEVGSGILSCCFYVACLVVLSKAHVFPFHFIFEIVVHVLNLMSATSQFRFHTASALRLSELSEAKKFQGHCSICYDSMVVSSPRIALTLPCGHFFHKNCLSRWLQRNRTCPYCRAPVPDFSH